MNEKLNEEVNEEMVTPKATNEMKPVLPCSAHGTNPLSSCPVEAGNMSQEELDSSQEESGTPEV